MLERSFLSLLVVAVASACSNEPPAADAVSEESSLISDDARLAAISFAPVAVCRFSPLSPIQHQLLCASRSGSAQELPASQIVEKVTIVAQTAMSQTRTWDTVPLGVPGVALAVSDRDLPVTVTTTATLRSSVAALLGVSQLVEKHVITSRADTSPRTVRLPLELWRVRVLLDAGARLHLEGSRTIALGSWTGNGASSLERSLAKDMARPADAPYDDIPILVGLHSPPISVNVSLDQAAPIPMSITGAGYYRATPTEARMAKRDEVRSAGLGESDLRDLNEPERIAAAVATMCTNIVAGCAGSVDGPACTAALEEKSGPTIQAFSDCVSAQQCRGYAACLDAAKTAP